MSNNKSVKEMCEFIAGNPTAFHTVNSIKAMLEDKGFIQLSESEKWDVDPGKKYYVVRNGSSIIAFVLGNRLNEISFNIVASHTDSPTYKIKENAELTSDKYTRLNVEGYGGMIHSTWLDKPLSIAGRVLVNTGKGIESRLICFDKDLVLIPNVAIHMNREVNDGYKYKVQTDLLPLFAEGKNPGALKSLVAKTLKVEEDAILGSDLYLYNRQAYSVWGLNEEYVSSPRLDDQECVYASVKALLEAKCNKESINICACFDNEEVGSGTKQGACSTFMQDVMKRIFASLGKTEEEYLRALSSSLMLSADNAHAVHPNHPEHTDATNCVYMNEGVVVKSHAGQKYTSDGLSMAVVKAIAKEAGINLQYFANHSDKPGGSTLGNLSQQQVSVKAVDIGLPQLAMHSSYETAGAKDIESMIGLMKAFYGKHFHQAESGLEF